MIDNAEGIVILSVAPAFEGARAVYVDVDDGSVFTRPVVCWAVVIRSFAEPQDDGSDTETAVTPVISDVKPNSEDGTSLACLAGNFIGVAAPGEDPAEVVERHRRILRAELSSDVVGEA